tara:strand:+ start:1061 stop:1480 length:420 start_codon:yes stop_codon:yes gene_type:complete
MSHLSYHNNVVQLNELFFTSHSELVAKVCKHLGHEDKVQEVVGLFLDKPDLKAKKDPNKPKRPKSAFLLFCDDERPKLIEKEKKNLKKGDKFNLGVVQKKLGDQWKKLGGKDKSKYESEHEKIKEKYYDDITEYETNFE